MVIEKLRQNARAQAALEQEQREAKARKRRARLPSLPKPMARIFSPAIAAHPIFLPALGIWGAALAGMSVLMLSRVMIARISMVAGLGALGSGASYVYAAVAAVIGAVMALIAGFAIQRLAKRSARAKRSRGRRAISENIGRHMRPIDPASDLGSESLDAPIDDVPFANTPENASEAVDSPQDNEVPAELYDTDAP
ncbi:MAG: hypothetical protein AAFQ13_10790, partial [Pseudomonadota bacterium]